MPTGRATVTHPDGINPDEAEALALHASCTRAEQHVFTAIREAREAVDRAARAQAHARELRARLDLLASTATDSLAATLTQLEDDHR